MTPARTLIGNTAYKSSIPFAIVPIAVRPLMRSRCSIPNTVELLVQCWQRAEQRVSHQWTKRSSVAGEETVTENLWEYLHEEFSKVNAEGRVEEAFKIDLCRKYPHFSHEFRFLDRISQGLFMECHLHNKQQEKKSGGDYGLVITRPLLSTSTSSLRISVRDQGLLCQAKIRSRRGKWGVLKQNQCAVLADRLSFAAIVSYDYEPAAGSPLKPIQWQPCQQSTIKEVNSWLKCGVFPSPIRSEEALWAVASGVIGTKDEGQIKDYILTEERQQWRIRIDWPDGKRPNAEVYLSSLEQPLHRNALVVH